MSKVRGGKAHSRAVEGKEEYGVWEELPVPRLDRDADISQLRRELHIHGRSSIQSPGTNSLPLPEFTDDPEFDWRGIRVRIQTRNYVDYNTKKPYSKTSTPAELRVKAIALARPQPPEHLVLHLVATAKLTYPSSGRGSKPRWEDLWREAYEDLYHKEDTWPTVEVEYQRNRTSPKMIDTAKGAQLASADFDREPYLEADIITAGVKHLYKWIPKNTLFILLDRNGKVVFLSFPDALQWFYSEEVTQHIKKDLEFLFYVEPPFTPDKQRHPLNSLWIKEHPEFDKTKMPKEDDDNIEKNRFHGVLHYGVHHEKGRERVSKPILHSDWLQPGGYSQALRTNTMENGIGVMTRAVAFLHKLADPESHDQCCDVVRNTKRCIITAEDEPYAMRALLGNLWTESHVDASDVHKGFAGLAYLGDFEGTCYSALYDILLLTKGAGGDLVLPQYRLVLPADHGNITLIRGHETVHSTLPWKGRSRYCAVHTGHQSVLVDAMAEKERRRVKNSASESRKRKREDRGEEYEGEEVEGANNIQGENERGKNEGGEAGGACTCKG